MRLSHSISIILIFFLFLNTASSKDSEKLSSKKNKEYRIERSISKEALACIDCHKSETPGIFNDWANSRHANSNITCIDCHLAENIDKDISTSHEKE